MRGELIAIAAMSLGSVVFAEINEDVVVVNESKFQPMADMVESANVTLLEIHHSMNEICDERLKMNVIMLSGKCPIHIWRSDIKMQRKLLMRVDITKAMRKDLTTVVMTKVMTKFKSKMPK